MHDWDSLFDQVTKGPPAAPAELALLAEHLAQPLSDEEIAEIVRKQINPFLATDPQHATWQPLDPRGWQLPSVPLPKDYLDLLRWSNGLWVKKGEREFGFFRGRDVREYLLSYHLPEYVAGAIPLGFDGGGIFAVLDTRKGAAEEYPVLAMHAGALDFNEAVSLAETFYDFCRGTESIQDLLSPPDPQATEAQMPAHLILTGHPGSLPLLVALRNHCELTIPTKELLELARNAPQVLVKTTRLHCKILMDRLPAELRPFVAVEHRVEGL